MTSRAPAARRAIAASANVLVVVTTSSTSQIRSGTSRPRRERNAPRTLRRRSRRSRSVWLGVSRVRQSATASKGISNSRARDRAICAAGLKPRDRSRRGCSGTGTTRSGRGPRRGLAQHRPHHRRGRGIEPPQPLLRIFETVDPLGASTVESDRGDAGRQWGVRDPAARTKVAVGLRRHFLA